MILRNKARVSGSIVLSANTLILEFGCENYIDIDAKTLVNQLLTYGKVLETQ